MMAPLFLRVTNDLTYIRQIIKLKKIEFSGINFTFFFRGGGFITESLFLSHTQRTHKNVALSSFSKVLVVFNIF